MYRLQSFANPLIFNSLAKKKFIFYIVIYNILYNFATSTLQKSKLYIIIHRNEVI